MCEAYTGLRAPSNLLDMEDLAVYRTDVVPDAAFDRHITARAHLPASVVKAVISGVAVHEIESVTLVQVPEDSFGVVKARHFMNSPGMRL